MQIFRLHTNEGRSYVRSTQSRLRAAMYIYIKQKRAEGLPLSNIMFCWSPVHIARTI